MEQKSIQSITVKELCELCDINRSTFYAHYPDVYALLAALEAELLAEFEEKLDRFSPDARAQDELPGQAMRAMFEFLAENADMGRLLLCHGGDMAFLEQVKAVVRQRVMDEWRYPLDNGEAMHGYVLSFVVSGCIGMLQDWLEQGMPVPAAEMAATVEKVLNKLWPHIYNAGA
jgi:AcrR family transcriptional regulator